MQTGTEERKNGRNSETGSPFTCTTPLASQVRAQSALALFHGPMGASPRPCRSTTDIISTVYLDQKSTASPAHQTVISHRKPGPITGVRQTPEILHISFAQI